MNVSTRMASWLLIVAACGAPAAGAPGADDELESTVALMTRIGFCGSPTFSPDGRRIAFLSNMSGLPQVWIVPVEGGWPVMVTALDDPVGGVGWSPGGDWLAISVAPGGGMNQQVYLVRPDGTGPRRLTDGGRDNNWLGDWSRDGTALAFASNRDNPAAMDAWLFDIPAGTASLVARNPGVGYLSDLTADKGRALLYRQRSRGDNDLYLIDRATGEETLLTEHRPPAQFDDASFAPDGSTVYLSSNNGRDRTALARIRLDRSGRPGPIEVLAGRDDAELQQIALTRDGSAAALVWNAAGRSEMELIELAGMRRSPVPSLPAEIVSGVTFSMDGRMLAFGAQGSASPSDIWVLDRPTGRLTRVTWSPHAGIDLATLVKPELVRFRAHDGLELTGWLYRPRRPGPPGPIVLSFHGGPEGQERPAFSSTYQALLARGIAVLAPNVRGSSGFGKRFVNLDNGALRADGIRDIESCVRFAVESGVADPKRIGIMGGSYGGYMVMAGLSRYPGLFAAGANLFGVVNFETFFAHTEPWMAAISRVEYGDPATQADLLRSLSPIHDIGQVVAPTIVLHGANDTNVPVVEAEQVVESLKKRGIPVDYVLFPDEGHGFRKTPNRIRSTVSIVRWFERHLSVRSSSSDR